MPQVLLLVLHASLLIHAVGGSVMEYHVHRSSVNWTLAMDALALMQHVPVLLGRIAVPLVSVSAPTFQTAAFAQQTRVVTLLLVSVTLDPTADLIHALWAKHAVSRTWVQCVLVTRRLHTHGATSGAALAGDASGVNAGAANKAKYRDIPED